MVPCLQQLADLDQDLDILEQRARFLRDELDAKPAAETNRQLYALSLITTVFLPPSHVASRFGENLEGTPWSGNAYGFWLALAVGLSVTGAFGLIIRRSRRRLPSQGLPFQPVSAISPPA